MEMFISTAIRVMLGLVAFSYIASMNKDDTFNDVIIKFAKAIFYMLLLSITLM